jgi:hypothetical protein
MKTGIVYLVKYMLSGTQLQAKKLSIYKDALKEAEGWVLSGKDYSCIIEWETFTGNKSLTLSYNDVLQQRKARTAYKKALKNNAPRTTYVDI